jgi:nucleoid DNA-binding protein
LNRIILQSLAIEGDKHIRKDIAMAAKKTTKKKRTKKATPVRKVTAVKKPMTKSAIMAEISDNTGLTKKQVASVLDELAIVIERHIKPRGPKQFSLPGLLKVDVKRKPATKARKGINPFTGEPMMFKAKPARNVVKIRPLKKLKEMVE